MKRKESPDFQTQSIVDDVPPLRNTRLNPYMGAEAWSEYGGDEGLGLNFLSSLKAAATKVTSSGPVKDIVAKGSAAFATEKTALTEQLKTSGANVASGAVSAVTDRPDVQAAIQNTALRAAMTKYVDLAVKYKWFVIAGSLLAFYGIYRSVFAKKVYKVERPVRGARLAVATNPKRKRRKTGLSSRRIKNRERFLAAKKRGSKRYLRESNRGK